jgi:PEP-CTERM motif
MNIRTALLISITFCLASRANAVELLINGGFELPAVTSAQGFDPYSAATGPNNGISGWVLSHPNCVAPGTGSGLNQYCGSSLVVSSAGFPLAHGGNQYLYLNETVNNGTVISQTFTAISSGTASLSYWGYASGSVASYAVTNPIISLYDSASNLVAPVSSTPATARLWTQFNQSFLLTSGMSYKLEFSAFGTQDGQSAIILIDDVSLTMREGTVPLPSSLMLFGLGLVGLKFSRRKL